MPKNGDAVTLLLLLLAFGSLLAAHCRWELEYSHLDGDGLGCATRALLQLSILVAESGDDARLGLGIELRIADGEPVSRSIGRGI